MSDRDHQKLQVNWELHPDENLLAAYFDGELEAAQLPQVEAHVAGCEICLGTVAMLAKTSDKLGGQITAQMADGSPSPELRDRALGLAGDTNRDGGTKGSWAAAAALFMLLGVGLIWSNRHEPSDPFSERISTPGESRILRGPAPRADGPTIQEPQAGQVLARGAIDFRWTDVLGASEYSLLVQSADGDPIWQTEVGDTRATLPESVVLETGQTYFVTVRAHLTEARTIPSSPVDFQVGHRP